MLKREVTVQDRIFLFIEEEYEVRKNNKGKIQYYTDKETGESGMSQVGLANSCGVNRYTLQNSIKNILEGANGNDIFYTKLLKLFDKDGANEIYLINDKSLKIIKDKACAKFIKYYGYEAKSKRTNAQRIYDLFAAKGIRNFIQEKTGFEKRQLDALGLSIEERLRIENQELKKENKELRAQNKVLEHKLGIPLHEKTFQSWLHAQLGGSRECYVTGDLAGRVDLITDKMVVEAKRFNNYEQAFGQLLRYKVKMEGTEHENKLFMIYLFGPATKGEKDIIRRMGEYLDFQIGFYSHLPDHIDEDELEP